MTINQQAPTLEDLNKSISILIVDDEKGIRESIQIALEREGYEYVWAVEKIDEAEDYLPRTNILLADYNLKTSKNSGIDLIRQAKTKYGENIVAILFTGGENKPNGNNFAVKGEGIKDEIKDEAIKANVTAYFEKPLRIEYVKLWIKELGKRIWMQKMLDAIPDEITVLEKTGTVLFANEEKKRIFGNDLIGGKCYDRFEEHPHNDLCNECPSKRAYDTKKIVRIERGYQTRAKPEKHKIHNKEQFLDIVAAPIFDIQNKPLALIEICRDITMQKVIDKIIEDMEIEKDWKKRRDIFMDGFNKLGYPRARLYLRDTRENRDILKLVDKRGEHLSNEVFMFNMKEHETSKLIEELRKPIIFEIDYKNQERKCEPDTVINNLYYIGSGTVKYNHILNLQKFIDIPLLADGEIIGKLSLDSWQSDKHIPDSYELDTLGHYCASAGQIIQNARNKRDIEIRENLGKVILEISREITCIKNSETLFHNAVKYAVNTMEVTMCSIFLFNKETERLEIKQSYARNESVKELCKETDFFFESYASGEYLTGRAFNNGKSVYINNFQELLSTAKKESNKLLLNLDCANYYESMLEMPLRNYLYVPLIVGDKKIGLLRAANKLKVNDFGDKDFESFDLELFELFAGQIAVALYNTMIQEEKVESIEDIAHIMRSNLQVMFSNIGKITEENYLPYDEIKKYGKILENQLIQSRNRLSELIMAIRDEPPKDFKFEVSEILPLIESVAKWEESKCRNNFLKKLESTSNIWVNLDKDKFCHALSNLVENAVKYSLSENNPIEIVTTLVDRNVRIEVVNYGVEITKSEQNKIFEHRFRGLAAEDMAPGLGIGLNTAKKIIKKFKGRIDVSSIPVEDKLYKNTFSIYLPVVKIGEEYHGK